MGFSQWNLQIKVSFTECKIKYLTLSEYLLELDYRIGSKAIEMPMPQVTQAPNCGKKFTFAIANWESERLT